MKAHIVTVGDFTEFLATTEVLLAQSQRVLVKESKSLKADLGGRYIVRSGGEKVFVGSLDDAVDIYNELY